MKTAKIKKLIEPLVQYKQDETLLITNKVIYFASKFAQHVKGNRGAFFIRCADKEGVLAVCDPKSTGNGVNVYISRNFYVIKGHDVDSLKRCFYEHGEAYPEEKSYLLLQADEDLELLHLRSIEDGRVDNELYYHSYLQTLKLNGKLDVFDNQWLATL